MYLLPRNRFGNFYSSPTRVFTTETQQEAVEAANALMGRHRQAQAPPCPMVSMLLVPAASLYTTTTIEQTPQLQTSQNTQCSSLPCGIDDTRQFRQDFLERYPMVPVLSKRSCLCSTLLGPLPIRSLGMPAMTFKIDSTFVSINLLVQW